MKNYIDGCPSCAGELAIIFDPNGQEVGSFCTDCYSESRTNIPTLLETDKQKRGE